MCSEESLSALVDKKIVTFCDVVSTEERMTEQTELLVKFDLRIAYPTVELGCLLLARLYHRQDQMKQMNLEQRW